MPRVRFTGTSAEARAAISKLVRILAGKEPDTSGIAEGLLTRMGVELLGKIQDAYVMKSEGGTDEMGISWPALSQTTLLLRHKVASAKKVQKLRREFSKLPVHRQQLVNLHYNRLLESYRAGKAGVIARGRARRLLKLIEPYITPGRARTLRGELAKASKEPRAKRLAMAGAFALILRDTGRLLNSLSPRIVSPDRRLKVGLGFVTVGSNVQTRNGLNLLDLHDGSRPRKRLPRRQVLPDAQKPIPPQWWRDLKNALQSGMGSREVWLKLLGTKAS